MPTTPSDPTPSTLHRVELFDVGTRAAALSELHAVRARFDRTAARLRVCVGTGAAERRGARLPAEAVEAVNADRAANGPGLVPMLADIADVLDAPERLGTLHPALGGTVSLPHPERDEDALGDVRSILAPKYEQLRGGADLWAFFDLWPDPLTAYAVAWVWCVVNPDNDRAGYTPWDAVAAALCVNPADPAGMLVAFADGPTGPTAGTVEADLRAALTYLRVDESAAASRAARPAVVVGIDTAAADVRKMG